MLQHIYDTDQYCRCSFAQKVQAVIEESYNFLFGGMGSGQRRQGSDVMCVCVCDPVPAIIFMILVISAS